MFAREIISDLMKAHGIGSSRLARLIGARNHQTIQKRLGGKDMRVGSLIELLAAFDYELIAQPKSAGARKSGAYLVDFDPATRSLKYKD